MLYRFTYNVKPLPSVPKFPLLVLCIIAVIYFASTHVTNSSYTAIFVLISYVLKRFRMRKVFYVYLHIFHFFCFLFLCVDLNFHRPSV